MARCSADRKQTGASHYKASVGRQTAAVDMRTVMRRERRPCGNVRAVTRASGAPARARAATGQLANRLREFGDGIGVLVADVGDRMENVVILAMTEFGLTARRNGNGGTDHEPARSSRDVTYHEVRGLAC
ncbi:MAG: DUF1501 domain-containing protein [Gemmatimonadaceae bacterium]|nr:DUF1501 domain-containing protein [Gemmatimonadaceae bacterium]